MLLKIIGALLVIFVCVSAGRMMAARLEKRSKILHDLQQGLLALGREIDYAAMPLPPALLQASSAAASAAELFEKSGNNLRRQSGISAEQAWQQSLQQLAADWPLTDEDMSVLSAFGCGLGLSSVEDQLRRLELIRQRLLVQEEEAQAQARQLGKVWKNLGWAAGIAIAIIAF
jgi:stage III sporulation protein AB